MSFAIGGQLVRFGQFKQMPYLCYHCVHGRIVGVPTGSEVLYSGPQRWPRIGFILFEASVEDGGLR